MCITTLAMVLRFEGLDTTIIRISNSFLLTVGALCQQGKYVLTTTTQMYFIVFYC